MNYSPFNYIANRLILFLQAVSFLFVHLSDCICLFNMAYYFIILTFRSSLLMRTGWLVLLNINYYEPREHVRIFKPNKYRINIISYTKNTKKLYLDIFLKSNLCMYIYTYPWCWIYELMNFIIFEVDNKPFSFYGSLCTSASHILY